MVSGYLKRIVEKTAQEPVCVFCVLLTVTPFKLMLGSMYSWWISGTTGKGAGLGPAWQEDVFFVYEVQRAGEESVISQIGGVCLCSVVREQSDLLRECLGRSTRKTCTGSQRYLYYL